MAFTDANWKPGNLRRWIVTISLTDPNSTRDTAYTTNPGASPVLRFCDAGDADDRGGLDYSSNTYFPHLIDMSFSGSEVSHGEQATDASADIIIANHRYIWQVKAAAAPQETNPYDVRLSQLLRNYTWYGAAVTVKMLVLEGTTYTEGQVFTGVVMDVQELDDRIIVSCLQDKKTNKLRPDGDTPTGAGIPQIITQEAYPDAPPSSIGKMIPLVYVGNPNVDTIFANPLSDTVDILSVNPNRLKAVNVALLTDTTYEAAGTTLAEMYANRYPVYGTPVGEEKLLLSVPEAGTMAYALTAWSRSNTSSFLEFEILDNVRFVVHLNPYSIQSSSANAREASFDGKLDTYSTVNGSTGFLNMNIPSITSVGQITSLNAFCLFRPGGTVVAPDADTVVYGRFGIWNLTAGAWYSTAFHDITKANCRDGGAITTPATSAVSRDVVNVRNWDWVWDNAGTQNTLIWRLQMTTASTSCRVIACGYLIEFIPRNLTREVHQPQWVPIIDVGGRLRGWRRI